MPARKPSALKKRQGTEQKCRVNGQEPQPILGRPELYGKLTEAELRYYDRIAADLSAMGVLAVTDGGALYDAAINLASLDAIRAEIRTLKSVDDADNFPQRSVLMNREEARSKMHRAYIG